MKMKPAYDFVIKNRYILCIVYCLAATWSNVIDSTFGAWAAVWASVFFVITGAMLFGMLMLYLRLGWNNQDRPGILAAVGAAGLIALLVSTARIIVMFHILAPSFYQAIEQTSWAGMVLVLFGFIWDIKVESYDKGN
jgi:hypothetical protein